MKRPHLPGQKQVKTLAEGMAHVTDTMAKLHLEAIAKAKGRK